jgi:5-methylcytosine-specific restriction endonuclease McrA
MSFNRQTTAEDKQESYVPGQCRYCKEDVKRYNKKARTFCSPTCVHEFKIRANPSYAREQVYKRDKGVCQLCGLNCSTFFAGLHKALKGVKGKDRDQAACNYFKAFDVEMVPWKHRSTFYDIDHIQQVASGGGECGMDNLRTLCLPCHRRVTKQFMAEHREAKRNGTA